MECDLGVVRGNKPFPPQLFWTLVFITAAVETLINTVPQSPLILESINDQEIQLLRSENHWYKGHAQHSCSQAGSQWGWSTNLVVGYEMPLTALPNLSSTAWQSRQGLLTWLLPFRSYTCNTSLLGHLTFSFWGIPLTKSSNTESPPAIWLCFSVF